MNAIVGQSELAAIMRPRHEFAMRMPHYGLVRVSVPRSPADMRRAIVRYERAVGALPQTDLPVRHFHIEGRKASHAYAREITIGRGVAAVGRVHKYQCINIVSKGRVLVASDEGVKEIVAPCTWVSEPGAKRALFVLEDLLWTTIHLTDELDPSKIKDDLGVVSYDEYLAYCASKGYDGVGVKFKNGLLGRGDAQDPS